jgi:hypothetical protein
MSEEREQEEANEEVEQPDEAVEDLEPSEGESDEVSGGAFKQGWPSKYTG